MEQNAVSTRDIADDTSEYTLLQALCKGTLELERQSITTGECSLSSYKVRAASKSDGRAEPVASLSKSMTSGTLHHRVIDALTLALDLKNKN